MVTPRGFTGICDLWPRSTVEEAVQVATCLSRKEGEGEEKYSFLP